MPALPSSTSDAASNRTRLAAAIGASADFVTEFSYDNLQRMTGIQQHGVSGGNAVADKRIDLAYNAAGQFSAISRYANIAGTQTDASRFHHKGGSW